MEGEITNFYKRLDEIKLNSISKLSHEKQKRIYLQIKREKEEAERKKEEDEREKRNK